MTKRQKWILFEFVITSTVLYGSCSWTMNNERRAKLLSAQTKMVRQMLGLQWWKSTAKWEAEQQMDDLKESEDIRQPRTPDDCGAEAPTNKGPQYRKKQPNWRGQTQRTNPLDTINQPKRSGRQRSQKHSPKKRDRSESTSSTTSSTSSSTDSPN